MTNKIPIGRDWCMRESTSVQLVTCTMSCWSRRFGTPLSSKEIDPPNRVKLLIKWIDVHVGTGCGRCF